MRKITIVKIAFYYKVPGKGMRKSTIVPKLLPVHEKIMLKLAREGTKLLEAKIAVPVVSSAVSGYCTEFLIMSMITVIQLYHCKITRYLGT